ncbi:hypothetical protein HN51_017259 [Arachis hypogaea]
MGPKRGQKVVIKSTRKVVQESVQVSIVGSSNKRTRRNNKDIQTGNEVVGEENVRIIPVQEVTPQPKENEISNSAHQETSTLYTLPMENATLHHKYYKI